MKKNRKSSLSRKIQWFIFLGWIASNVCTVIIFLVYYYIFGNHHYNALFYIITTLIISVVLGTTLANFFIKKTDKHFLAIRDVLNQIARGNFAVKIIRPKNVFLASVADDFNRMVDELSSVQTLRNDFITNFSHEFKTPIVSIHGFAEILLTNPDLPEDAKREYLQIIYDESARLSNLSTNTLLMSRLDTQKAVAKQGFFYLDEQIRQCVLLFEQILKQKEMSIKIRLDKIYYYGSEDLIQQIWINLISNAVKFSNIGDKIMINSTIADEDIIISIADTGKGMDEETLKFAFEKFYQGDLAHSSSGNGLGLPIVKRILELTGGSIKMVSTKNKGTTITITLPKKE